MRRPFALVLAASVVLSGFGLVPAGSAAAAPAAPGGPAGPTVWTCTLSPEQVLRLRELGVDREALSLRRAAAGQVAVNVVLSRAEAARLRKQGIALAERRVGGATATQRMAAEAANGYAVYRSYSEPGGIRDELIATARANPGLTKLVSIGKTVQGKDILAIKVTKDATKVRDGARPSVLYNSAQHAREWITPEMDRRLLHWFIDNYATSAEIRRVVDSTELWFVPVSNPDGYDFTFTEGNRLWRKNLRDNDGDGTITGADGVDPNRNWPTHWGYDNEGSSPSFGSATYRGTAPRSEPETRALDGLMRRVGFEFQVNYHSAAELLLYGTGFQVATPTPDDVLYEAYAGDDARPAIPGYDPDISAELYTTNGETTEHSQNAYGTLAYTPEMTTCETASAIDPDDPFEPEDCLSGFNFPDSEVLIQAEFEKNVPFALSLAKSARNPANPVSAVGRTAPDFVLDPFTVSYGDPQPVAVTASRNLRNLTLNYRINGGQARTAPAREWRGGERYGDENDVYYAEFRGAVRGAKQGDRVQVWFTGTKQGAARSSARFTYTVASAQRAQVLVLSNEDYEGVNPTYPAGTNAPKYAQQYVDALRSQGISSVVYDISQRGVPHHLGVLAHFRGVVWYLGENRLTQDPEDELTQYGSRQLPDAAVAERAQYTTMSVRDYLNEGGKLLYTGETAGYYGTLANTVGGIYYGLDGDPTADCAVTVDPFSDCLFLADDFSQYWLGAYNRSSVSSPTSVSGAGPLAGASATFGGPGLAANPLNEAGSFLPTSSVLPAEQFPLFASEPVAEYDDVAGGAFTPVEGEWYVGAAHVDGSYARLGRTVDLTGVAASAAPALQAQLSFATEDDYDYVIVEAHTVGQDDWTTLPEAGGATTTTSPAGCDEGYFLGDHPFLTHYLTEAPPGPCTPTGTTGAWNAFNGDSEGWTPVSFDLSAYAGKQVEVVVSYVTDGAVGAVGVFLDDTRVVAGGQTLDAEGFEAGLGPWAAQPPPPGSSVAGTRFLRSTGAFSAGVATRDTVLLGFGLEQLATSPTTLGRAVKSLIR